MVEKTTTYTITLSEVKALKLFHLIMNNVDGELWDNDLEAIYYEMKESIDMGRFDLYMMGELE